MHLRHIHLPSNPAPIPYETAARLQEHFRRIILDGKDASSSPICPPTLISFTTKPTFTLGRRQHGKGLDPAALARLKAPLKLYPDRPTASDALQYEPEVIESPRGGLTTYHGPGQMVLWPVVDLRSPGHRNYGVRDWACALEKTTIAVLSRKFGLRGFRTKDPGVWLEVEGEPRKVAAMGVALRRYVSSLGVAINVDMPGTADGGRRADAAAQGIEGSEEGNPWLRFVPCGLEGKAVASIAGALGHASLRGQQTAGKDTGSQLTGVGHAWADELADRLGLEGVHEDREEDVMALLTKAQVKP